MSAQRAVQNVALASSMICASIVTRTHRINKLTLFGSKKCMLLHFLAPKNVKYRIFCYYSEHEEIYFQTAPNMEK